MSNWSPAVNKLKKENFGRVAINQAKSKGIYLKVYEEENIYFSAILVNKERNVVI